jgi:branched-chain amino acid aminotransferase
VTSGRVVMIDGVIVPPDEARVSVFDRGFLYGDSVFEVLRTYGGVPFALGEHLTRLRRSGERVFIAMPVDPATLGAEVERAVRASRQDGTSAASAAAQPAPAESYVRIVVTRGSGPMGLDPDLAGAPLRVIVVEPVSPPPREAYVDGVAVITVRMRRAVDGTAAAGAKVSNYLPNLLAVREAKSRGAHEALVIDAAGRVVEGASSNVFIVRGGRVATPPESAGILPGITRAHVLAAASALGVPVQERDISQDELYAADEVFVTSSIRELLSVVRVDGHAVGTGRPGPVSRSLHRRFHDDVGLAGRPMPYEP